VNTVDIGSSTQITGEVVNIQADESILDERGKYDLAKLNPIIYDEEQFAYRTVGGKTADAFKAGLVYKNK
jgi:flavin reductase (DIM6/NTAB) family NADH-FMN oxidoreductase RutF